MRVHIECIESLAQAFVESYIEAYQTSGVDIERKDVEAIISELRSHVRSWFASLHAQPDIGRFLATQSSDANTVVARARQTLILKVNQRILTQERAAMHSLERMVLERLGESDITFTLAQLKVALPDCSNIAGEQWFTTLEGLRERGFISTSTPAGPFLITRQGKNYLLSLQQGTVQKQETIMGDKYEIHGQAGAVGPRAQAHDVNFIQIWNQPGQSVDLSKLAEELAALRQAMAAKATAPEHYTAIGEVASAETQAKNGNGPKVLEHLSKAGKWALDFARDMGVQVAAELIIKTSGLRKEAL